MTVTKKIAATASFDLDDLRRAVAMLCRVVDRRNTIPVLSNIAIAVHGAEATLTATDLHTYLSVGLVVSDAGKFSTTVNAAALSRVLAAATGERVTIGYDGDRCTIAGDGFTASLMTIHHDDFPAFQMSGTPVTASIDPARFAADMAFLSPAMSTEEVRYYLNGIALDSARGNMVATDGHRLHIINACPIDAPAGCVIIPRRTVALIKELLRANAGANVAALSLTTSKAVVAVGNWTLKTKLIDGTFPDYTRINTAENDKGFTVEARALRSAVRLATATQAESTKGVRFDFKDGAVEASGRSPENGTASAMVRGAFNIVPMSEYVRFNRHYLTQIIDVFGGNSTLRVDLRDSIGPARFTADGITDRAAILMPMRV